MRKYVKILFLVFIPILGMAQQSRIDSLKSAFKNARTDSARYSLSTDCSYYYIDRNKDSALYYIGQSLSMAQRNRQTLDEASCLGSEGYVAMHLGKYPEAYQYFQQALKIAENAQNENKTWHNAWFKFKTTTPRQFRLMILAYTYHNIGLLMGTTGNTGGQLLQFGKAEKLAKELHNQELLGIIYMNVGSAYLGESKLDSALVFEKMAVQLFDQVENKRYLPYDYEILGITYLRKGNEGLALDYFHKGVAAGLKSNINEGVGYCYDDLAQYYLSKKQKDSSLYYAKKRIGILYSMRSNNLDAGYDILYQSYKLRNELDSAYKYQGLALAAKDSSYHATLKSLTDFQRLSFNDQIHLQQLEKEKAATETRIRTYALSSVIGVFMLLAIIFYRNNRQKQKANHLLIEQKEEIETQRDNLGQALEELKNTQTQLVQREKMASLGELTAGIAHEIQNPLNFVNNFSEVSVELLAELREEEEKGNKEDVIAIADDLTQNLEKIRHHGKRADAIVKGMLQHSQSGSGAKEPTNINALADEYLRLSFHGLRAKDKEFNAELVTHFDEKLPKINVIPQDIGRVMLNLFNNAFYAVNQKQKAAGPDYKPEVSVNTSAENGQVVIKVKDNGTGIPDAIKEKIMQPFFTTKPTGEGTGLGLSLTYDMVVKGHGGKIDINTKEGEFTEFTVSLPL